jgi:hypothetical protein
MQQFHAVLGEHGHLVVAEVHDLFRVSHQRPGITGDEEFSLTDAHIISIISDPDDARSTDFGFDLDAVGDVNRDGWPDLLVGARYSSRSGAESSGAAYLFLGSDDPDELAAPDIIIAGQRTRAGSAFGQSVAGAVLRTDGMGPAVLLVGAPLGERDGPVHGEVGAVYIGLSDFE